MPILTPSTHFLLKNNLLTKEQGHALLVHCHRYKARLVLESAILDNNEKLELTTFKDTLAKRDHLTRKIKSGALIFETLTKGKKYTDNLTDEELSKLETPTLKLLGQLISWSKAVSECQEQTEKARLASVMLTAEKRACIKSMQVELTEILDHLKIC